MKRQATGRIRQLMDEWLPVSIRDNRWFMYPFFHYWFKGQRVALIMDFKERVHQMSPEEYADVYRNLACRAGDRPTDLNDACIEFMLESLDTKSSTLLDVGCGRGHFLNEVAKGTELELTGCDLFEDVPLSRGRFVRGTAEELPFADQSFDIVVCSHTLEHIVDIRRAVAELLRVARRQLIIVVPCQKRFKYTLDLHVHFFESEADLDRLLGVPNASYRNLDGDWVMVWQRQSGRGLISP